VNSKLKATIPEISTEDLSNLILELWTRSGNMDLLSPENGKRPNVWINHR
jgi:hypothetical protein